MATPLVDENGRLVGTRITVYNLLLDFLDSERTEAEICKLYGLTPHQVSAGRAYIFENIDRVLTRHLEIEARNAAGNPPEVTAEANRIREIFGSYRNWMDHRRREMEEWKRSNAMTANSGFPTFREWLKEQEAQNEGA